MKNSEVYLNSENYSNLVEDKSKSCCLKCGGSGNLKTPENSRRTCLDCFGRGFIFI